MKAILQYLEETYHPDGLILYGSYADGSNNQDSDFDALLIAQGEKKHDTSTVDGVRLDAFVYPPEMLDGLDCEEVVQIYGGRVAKDVSGRARALMDRVTEYVENAPSKTPEELQDERAWCEKMLRRARRGDPEGDFRGHWLLTESLEILCDILGVRYLGPKKSLRMLKERDAAGYALYAEALRGFDLDALERWIHTVISK